MKTCVIFSLAVLATMTAKLCAREFTDLQGRKLDAEIVSATNEQVTLKRTADGRAVTSNVSIFSAEDQKFIRDYAVANVKYSFEVRYTKKKRDEKKIDSGGSQGTLERWFYSLSFRNLSAMDAEGVSVDYAIYMKEAAADGRTPPRMVESGTEKLQDVRKNATGMMETKAVEIIRLRPKPGYYFTSGEGGKSDQLAGFSLKFMKDGKEIFSYTTNPDFFVK